MPYYYNLLPRFIFTLCGKYSMILMLYFKCKLFHVKNVIILLPCFCLSNCADSKSELPATKAASIIKFRRNFMAETKANWLPFENDIMFAREYEKCHKQFKENWNNAIKYHKRNIGLLVACLLSAAIAVAISVITACSTLTKAVSITCYVLVLVFIFLTIYLVAALVNNRRKHRQDRYFYEKYKNVEETQYVDIKIDAQKIDFLIAYREKRIISMYLKNETLPINEGSDKKVYSLHYSYVDSMGFVYRRKLNQLLQCRENVAYKEISVDFEQGVVCIPYEEEKNIKTPETLVIDVEELGLNSLAKKLTCKKNTN